MEEFIVRLESIANDGTPWSTQLAITANNKNEAAIRAINWLTKQELTLDTIDIYYKEYED